MIAASWGCGDDDAATEILVVTSEQGAPLELEELVLRVEALDGDDAELVRETRTRTRYAAGTLSPWSVTVGPRRPSDVGRVLYRFTVQGIRDGGVYVARQHRLAFVNGLRLTLQMRLSQLCAGVDCGPNQTCGEAVCIGDFIPPCTLAPAGQRCDDPIVIVQDAGDMATPDVPETGLPDLGLGDLGMDQPDVRVELPDADMMVVPADAGDMMIVEPPDLGTDRVDMGTDPPPDMGPDVADMMAPPPDTGPTGCVSDMDCNDGDPCTMDRCTSPTCTSTPMVCDDANPCTIDRCSSVTGMCASSNAADDTTCGGSQRCCSGACVSVDTTSRCGSCGTACGSNQSCASGACTCNAGFGDCTAASGCESSFSSDEAHCGSCTTTCTAGMSCVSGTCRDCTMSSECNDGLSCTTDTCSGGGTCSNTVSTGCLIAGACIASGATNPANPCQVCTPATSTTAWSAATNGTACNDGLFCTATDTCQAGVCTGSGSPCPDPSSTCVPFCDEAENTCDANVTGPWCWIDGRCVHETWDGSHPSNQCLGCEPSRDRFAWTWRSNSAGTMGEGCNDMMYCTASDICQRGATLYDATCVGSGATCDDGLVCTNDVCNEGSNRCNTPTVVSGYCYIGGACYTMGNPNPTNPCQYCNTATPTAWTNRLQGYNCGDLLECCNGVCQGCSDASCGCTSCEVGQVCDEGVGSRCRCF